MFTLTPHSREYLSLPYDIPDLPERVPKRIALISTIGSCRELSDLGEYGSAVTQFEALKSNPIQMTLVLRKPKRGNEPPRPAGRFRGRCGSGMVWPPRAAAA